ncbi:MAG: pentapeptide repeat-containing protein [Flavobacteriales bacterium]|nr:pentapeptide repeat-containing protein [Flavobacteriales bacterium]
MADHFEYDRNFTHLTPESPDFQKGEYENCTFQNCNFSHADLSEFVFMECEFIDCDLSNAQIRKASFKTVTFTRCKLMGLRWDECHNFLLRFTFDECLLNFSSFYAMDIKGTEFAKCSMVEVDFTDADCESCSFQGANMAGAMFDHTNLQKANFREAINYRIHPTDNNIRGAQFSTDGVSGLLEAFQIQIVD